MSFEDNKKIADIFHRSAQLLELQGADPYRVQAYRRAATLLANLNVDVRELWQRGGRDGLETVPSIGTSLAAHIEEILTSGHCRMLDRLEGHANPEDLFQLLPGGGAVLAHRIHETLHIDSLEEVEAAAFDSRLAKVPGIGAKRAAEIQTFLAERLGSSTRRGARSRPASSRHPGHQSPSIAILLSIDQQYRKAVEQKTLPLITPRRYNATHSAWLPVWHTRAEGWSFTALYSNTSTAHRMGKTRDWVVLVAEKDGHEEQFTVVTEYRGDLEGLRVVRGLEEQCRLHYARPLAPDIETIHELARDDQESVI